MVLHRPLTAMYGDNYRYGTSLYSPGADDIERKYRSSLSRTNLRSDRGDLGLYTFAGSNLHGGTPAAEKVTGPKITGSRSGTHDLYAPLNVGGYGPNYYSHLRATTPEPRSRVSKPVPYYALDDPDYKRTSYNIYDDSSYKTVPTKISYESDGDLKTTTTKKTTVTEEWVPLTTHIYNTPYHTYYYRATPYSSYTYRTADDLYDYTYADDYKRYSSTTTTTKSKNIDALDLSSSSKVEYNRWMDKCQEIHSQLSEVNKWVSEAEERLKSNVVSSRTKLQSELSEVSMIVEDTAKYNEELHRAIKRQAKQINSLNSQYDEINHHLADISDTLEKSRVRCQTLQSDLASVQTGIEMAMKRRI